MINPHHYLKGQIQSVGQKFDLILQDPFSSSSLISSPVRFKIDLNFKNRIDQWFSHKWTKMAISDGHGSITWGFIKLKGLSLALHTPSSSFSKLDRLDYIDKAKTINDLFMKNILHKTDLELGYLHLGLKEEDVSKFYDPMYQFVEYLDPYIENMIPNFSSVHDADFEHKLDAFDRILETHLTKLIKTDPYAHQALSKLGKLYRTILSQDALFYQKHDDENAKRARYYFLAVRRFFKPVCLAKQLFCIFPQFPSQIAKIDLIKELLGLPQEASACQIETTYSLKTSALTQAISSSDTMTRLSSNALDALTILQTLHDHLHTSLSDRFHKPFEAGKLRAAVKYRLGLEEDDFSQLLENASNTDSSARAVARELMKKILGAYTDNELTLRLLSNQYHDLLKQHLSNEELRPSLEIAKFLLENLDKQASSWNAGQITFRNPFADLCPIQSIPEADLSDVQTNTAHRFSLQATLGFWVHKYYSIFFTLPFDPFSFFEIFAPLVTHPKSQSLNLFLAKLASIKDFKNAFSAPTIIDTIVSILHIACSDEDFKESVFNHIEDALDSCHDRVALCFDNLSLLLQFKLCSSQSLFDLMNLILGLERKHLVERWAIADARTRFDKFGQILDQIEVVLFYQTRLKKRLDLPGVISDMTFPSMADVAESQLEEAFAFVVSHSSTQEHKLSVLTNHSLWQDLLKKVYNHEFMSLNETYSEKITEILDDETLIQSDAKKLIDELQLGHSQKTYDLVVSMTQDLLSSA